MPDLNFQVERAEAERYSASPLLQFRLRIEQAEGENAATIHAIALRCQIRIEPGRRRYTAEQRDALLELFGLPDHWARSLRPMLWTHASTVVQAFTGSTTADLPVPCTYDFSLAATKYFDALGDDGDIPLCFLFSGTVFYQSTDGNLQAAPISWEKEANFSLPARVWRDLMQAHYPNAAWLCLDNETFDRLRAFKMSAGHTSLDQTLNELLAAAEDKVLG